MSDFNAQIYFRVFYSDLSKNCNWDKLHWNAQSNFEWTYICMYVYNIIEAQNKSAQKKNCEFNMQYANSSKKISASIYTYLVYTFARTKAFMCVERYFSLFLHSLKVKYFWEKLNSKVLNFVLGAMREVIINYNLNVNSFEIII